jgi:hypothetical protein
MTYLAATFPRQFSTAADDKPPTTFTLQRRVNVPVCMTDTATVKRFVQLLRDAGCSIEEDYNDALTVKATDGTTVVYWALQKGRNGPWIVRYNDSERIHFPPPVPPVSPEDARYMLWEGMN